MRFLLLISLAACLTGCAGYDLGFGIGTAVNGVPVRVDVAAKGKDRSKDAKNVQPVQP